MFRRSEFDAACVYVLDEAGGPVEDLEAVFNPCLGSAERFGEADGAVGVLLDEWGDCEGFFHGRHIRACDVLREAAVGGGLVVVVLDDGGDGGPAELQGGGEAVAARD